MRITYLAHASLLVEAGDVRLVTDPWLDGPTYLSAWWHFPAPAVRGADLRPTHIYLTHEHADHFHPRTLQAVPKQTPILIGRFAAPRFRRALERLGFGDVRELPHGAEVELGGGALRLTSYQYRADDTGLVIRDREATVFNLNDCLLRAGALEQVLGAHPRIDLLLASFANAEAYPIVYELEDPAERPDWDDGSRFDAFLERVRDIAPAAFVPFASMFCFLDRELFWLNDRIASPWPLVERARRGEVGAAALPMNPGDVWTPAGGHEVKSRVDWAHKTELLDGYARDHAVEIASLATAEVVPGGRAALAGAFETFFRGFAARVPLALRGKLDLRVRLDVTGPAGGVLWLRFARGRLDLGPPASDDQWDVRIVIRDWPLHRVVTRQDWWQYLGISCRYRVVLRPGARPREAWFWALLYLDDMGYLEALPLVSPRALGVAFRRRRELLEYAWDVLAGRFGQRSLRGKFGR